MEVAETTAILQLVFCYIISLRLGARLRDVAFLITVIKTIPELSFFLETRKKLAPVAGVLSVAKFSLRLFYSFCSWQQQIFLLCQNFFSSSRLASLSCCNAGPDGLKSC